MFLKYFLKSVYGIFLNPYSITKNTNKLTIVYAQQNKLTIVYAQQNQIFSRKNRCYKTICQS